MMLTALRQIKNDFDTYKIIISHLMMTLYEHSIGTRNHSKDLEGYSKLKTQKLVFCGSLV